jgi:hypothetical protein
VSELERQLTQLGRELDWPRTPELSASVAARLPKPTSSVRHRRVVFRRSLAIALAALLVLAGGVFAAVPGVRDAVLDFFGLQGATVERREQLPPPTGKPAALDLGERTSLSAARSSLGFGPVLPEAAGRPDGVFVSRRVPGGALSLTFRPRAGLPRARTTDLGLLVEQFRGDLTPEYFGKTAGQTTTVERLRIDGERAVWLEGAPHFFFYRPPGAEFQEHELRLAQNVLLLEHGRLLVRMEGAFGRAKAVELARSLR